LPPFKPVSRRIQLGVMLAAFVVATLVAKLFGAGWGTASAFGQLAFAATVVWAMLIDEPAPH
jgi:hypothetical protein